MSNESSLEDYEADLNEMGFSLSLSEFEKSLQSEDSAQQQQAIRGEGIAAKTYMSNIRLANDLHELKIHQAPMGHMPTSTEILGTTPENEITPLLRKLGICCQDGELSSRRTRMVPQIKEEIKIDRRIPLIFNEEIFDVSGYRHESDCSDLEEEEREEEVESDDPNLPLEVRFSTLKEFQQVSATKQAQPNSRINDGGDSFSSYLESSGACTSSSKNTPDMSSHSTTADDASSSTGGSTSYSTYSVENQCSSDWHAEPPLLKKSKLYTPRELYDIKNGKRMNRYGGVSRQ